VASSELAAFGAKLERITDPGRLTRIVEAGGLAGKKAALEAASRDLGGDRAFSGLRRKAPLGAGYDRSGPTSVVINFRPAGLWVLADRGRRTGGVILPKKRGKKRVLIGTEFGPVTRSQYKPAPRTAKNTYDDAVKKAQTTVPKAAFKQFVIEVGSVF
jgi:hypothetical protein